MQATEGAERGSGTLTGALHCIALYCIAFAFGVQAKVRVDRGRVPVPVSVGRWLVSVAWSVTGEIEAETGLRGVCAQSRVGALGRVSQGRK